MGLIIVLVFLGAFSVVALIAAASGTGASAQAKQVHATLDSALATDSPEERGPDPRSAQDQRAQQRSLAQSQAAAILN
jgi:hypothetical protein